MAFEMDQVVGSGSVQTLVCQPINFPAPAEEVKEIRKTVIVDNCMAVIDKVIVDGRLRKDIMFKQANAGFPVPGNVSACTGVIATVTGPILDVDVDIAFNALISVPGARPGDRCVVLQAFVEGEKEEAANINQNGSFNTLVDKSIVFLCVKVVRETTMTTATGGAGGATTVCPPRMSTGFFPGGAIPPARPGIIPGTFIGPTLIFAGVLNPGAPTTVPPTNPVVNTTGSQVQISPAAMQTTTTGTTGTTGSTVSGTGTGTVLG